MFKVKRVSQSNRTVRLPDELIDRLNAIATEADISFNRLVVQCCEYALANLQMDGDDGEDEDDDVPADAETTEE